jgi:hypothetical protein
VHARARHCQLFDGCEPGALIPKATPAVLRRTAGVAQGEELRAEPRGKVPHGLCWLSHAHSRPNHRERQVSRLPFGRSGARFAQCKHYRTFHPISLPCRRDMSWRGFHRQIWRDAPGMAAIAAWAGFRPRSASNRHAPKPVRKTRRRRYSAPPSIRPSTIRGCAREACVRATCDPEACAREVYDPEACDPDLRCDRDGLRTA